jgi:hypothetical protein
MGMFKQKLDELEELEQEYWDVKNQINTYYESLL